MEECIFCKIAKKEIKSKIIYENNNFFSIPDANQVIDGHSLVISKKHFETTLDLPNSIATELLDCVKKTALKVMEQTKSEGFNIINNNFKVAGQFVNHVHYHILPRKKGDKVPPLY